jgi:hypothetical protein
MSKEDVMNRMIMVLSAALLLTAAAPAAQASPLIPKQPLAAAISFDNAVTPVRWGCGYRGWRCRHYGWYRGHHYGWRHHRGAVIRVY